MGHIVWKTDPSCDTRVKDRYLFPSEMPDNFYKNLFYRKIIYDDDLESSLSHDYMINSLRLDAMATLSFLATIEVIPAKTVSEANDKVVNMMIMILFQYILPAKYSVIHYCICILYFIKLFTQFYYAMFHCGYIMPMGKRKKESPVH